MQVFVLENKLFTFFKVLRFEENRNISFYVNQNVLYSALNLLHFLLSLCFFYLFLQLEHVHHKTGILDLGLLLDVYAFELHLSIEINLPYRLLF